MLPKDNKFNGHYSLAFPYTSDNAYLWEQLILEQMEKPRYIDPTSDFGFKRIFASEPNKDLLISFINELFRGQKTVVDLSYDKNEFVGDTDELGSVILDLTCTASNGERFVIEVQRTSQFNFKRRMLYYGSKLIADQAPKGKRKEWAYDISEVYVIVLMDGFAMPGSEHTEQYLHDVCLCDRDTGKVFYDHLEFFYIELVNFVKEESELQTDLESWLFVLKNMSRLDKIPVYLRKPIFEKLFQIAEYSKLSKEEKAMYDVSLKRKWDNKAVLDFAKEEGRKEEAIAIAREMKKEGLPVAQIAKFTKLSIKEIENIK